MKNEKQSFTISLDAVIVKDPNIGGYTGFFKQFSNVIAEGETEDEVMENLFKALHDVMLHKSKEIEDLKEYNPDVIEKSVELNGSIF